jgi:hypothetical protein
MQIKLLIVLIVRLFLAEGRIFPSLVPKAFGKGVRGDFGINVNSIMRPLIRVYFLK